MAKIQLPSLTDEQIVVTRLVAPRVAGRTRVAPLNADPDGTDDGGGDNDGTDLNA